MVPVRVPRMFCSIENERGECDGLILEDLSLMPDASPLPLRPSVDQAKLVVGSLSQLHAHFWGERLPAASEVRAITSKTDFGIQQPVCSCWA